MVCNYPGAYYPTSKEWEQLNRKAAIVFDTDMLKAIASLSDNCFCDLIDLFKRSKVLKRLWLPQNVVYAYFHNLKPEHNNCKMDTFFDLISQSQLGLGYNKAQLAYLYKRGQERYDKHIPPGLVGGESDKRIYFHDYLIWKEMQAYAGRKNRDILFVKKILDERWVEKSNGKICTNHEIANEFYDKTKNDFTKAEGNRFYVISIKQLLDLCDSQCRYPISSTQSLATDFVSKSCFKNQSFINDKNEDKNNQDNNTGSVKA